MLNRPTSSWSDDSSDANSWDAPQFRFALLWVAMVVPMLLIGLRVAQLQLSLQDDFVSAFSLTSESFEEIPARDGRILDADGNVLAGDVQQYSIAVYYPAIENPPDDRWITAKAKPRLSKSDRRNKEKLAAEKVKVIAEHESLWEKLAELTQRPLEEISQSREKIQARVQHIKQSVERRYRERQAQAEAQSIREEINPFSSWSACWQWVQRATAEPPERHRGPRLISEELDYCTVITDVTADAKAEIEAHPERYPYTRVVVQSQRIYPQGELACHLIGTRKPLTNEDLLERKAANPDGDPQDYQLGDRSGQFGLERSYDVHLKGVRGQRVLVKNRRGEIIETRVVREPRHGHDLVLTLDPHAQRRAEQILDEALTRVTPPGAVNAESQRGGPSEATCPQGGSIVAIDVQTGAVIAAASAPRFDLNLLISTDSSRWEDLLADRRSPMLSRVTHMALPPGSVFKAISAVASIESGKMPPDAHFHCRGYLDRPDQHRCLPFRHQHVGHFDVTLADALCRSCNVYFFTAARRMGPQTLVDWARQFGIGQPTGIDLPSEGAGNLPSPEKPMASGGRWTPGETLGLSIGQSELTVTPLQMARVMAAIANDGNLVTPHLAANSGPATMSDPDSMRSSFPSTPTRPIKGLHQSTLDYVREGLTMVVHDPKGTAYKTVRLKEVSIAGKTGTAETSGVDHAWFAGYVPAERPRIAFVVVLEHGGGGGKAAGPVAREFVKALLEADLIHKSTEVASDHSNSRR